ncbi:hypothetical protein D9M71_643910 [compost metagenome]
MLALVSTLGNVFIGEIGRCELRVSQEPILHHLALPFCARAVLLSVAAEPDVADGGWHVACSC